MDGVEERNKRLKKKEDNLKDQSAEENDGRPGGVTGMPENVRVVYSEEHIRKDG
jgi:hypothetical protein